MALNAPFTSAPDTALDAAELEAALPSLTEKLGDLCSSLTEAERAVLGNIVSSASRHLREREAVHTESEYLNSLPASPAVARRGAVRPATPAIRTHLVDLPGALGFDED